MHAHSRMVTQTRRISPGSAMTQPPLCTALSEMRARPGRAVLSEPCPQARNSTSNLSPAPTAQDQLRLEPARRGEFDRRRRLHPEDAEGRLRDRRIQRGADAECEHPARVERVEGEADPSDDVARMGCRSWLGCSGPV